MPRGARLLLALHLEGAHKHGEAVSEGLGQPHANVGVEGEVLGQLVGDLHGVAHVGNHRGALHGVGLGLVDANLVDSGAFLDTGWDGESTILWVVQLSGGEVHYELPVTPLGGCVCELG